MEICSASSAAKVCTYLQHGINYITYNMMFAFAQSAPLIIEHRRDQRRIIRDAARLPAQLAGDGD